MSNSSISTSFDLILNLASIFADVLAIIICVTFLSIIFYHHIQMKNRRGFTRIHVPLILSINIYCILLVKTILEIIHVTIPTLLKDFHLRTDFEETLACRLRAYLLWSMFGILFWSYFLLAFFHFVRVFYPYQLWLYRSSFYLFILIPNEFILVFISMLPIFLFFNGIRLLPNEAYCSIIIQPFYILIYTSIISFYIPYTCICLFYSLVGRKIKQVNVIRPYYERNQRDLKVIQKIFLNTIVLSIVSVPYLIFYIYNFFDDHFESSLYRVQWLSSSLSACIFSLSLSLITTRLSDLLKFNRLRPLNNNR